MRLTHRSARGCPASNFSGSIARVALKAKGIEVVEPPSFGWSNMVDGLLGFDGDENDPGPARAIAGFVVHRPGALPRLVAGLLLVASDAPRVSQATGYAFDDWNVSQVLNPDTSRSTRSAQ